MKTDWHVVENKSGSSGCWGRRRSGRASHGSSAEGTTTTSWKRKVTYSVIVMRAYENVSVRWCQSVVKLHGPVRTHTSATIYFLSRSVIL